MPFDSNQLSRRRMLGLAASMAALGFARTASVAAKDGGAQLRKVDPKERRLLFVLGAWGGASIIDSFMPVAAGEVGDAGRASGLNVFPDAQLVSVPQSTFRVPKPLEQYGIFAKPKLSIEQFTAKHGKDVAVVAHEVSSVNHAVAQQRALNGSGINRGRTLMEAMALRYGGGMALPNCNMASDGYVRHGTDASIPTEARHELVTSPRLFALGTHGSRGIPGAPGASAIAAARTARDRLEQTTLFARTFADDERRARYLANRAETALKLESAGVVDKLLLVDPASVDPRYGVTIDPMAAKVRSLLPELDSDRLQAQVGLAFLLAYHGVSTSVTFGYTQDAFVTSAGVVGAPIAFDFSHNNHRQAQSAMWARTLGLLDVLIDLLKTHDYLGDPALGKMWDRSLIYIATEFGRDKTRSGMADSWGTGHDLNNGSVLISPLLRGGIVYGGVDPRTCHTHGFDPDTGKDIVSVNLNEGDIYGIIAHALDLDSTTKRYPSVVRG